MPTLCSEIDELKYSSRKTRIAKREGELGLSAFVRWLSDQADGWCEGGVCSTGNCDGRTKGTRARLLAETDEYIEVRFSTTVYCFCEGQEEETQDSGDSSNDGNEPAPPSPGKCTRAQEAAELQSILGFYTAAINNARSTGYQAANDGNYSDPGLGFHRVGNCADWQQVSWSSLVTRTWNCWKVQQIRARQHYTLFGFHHFVKLEGVSGRVVYLDPWRTGNPDYFESASFPFRDGVNWAHTVTHTHAPGARPRDPGND